MRRRSVLTFFREKLTGVATLELRSTSTKKVSWLALMSSLKCRAPARYLKRLRTPGVLTCVIE